MDVQTTFLAQIRKNLPETVSFVDELAEILTISRDSAYRRIRGETVLSLDEVKKLYDRFQVSIDGIFSPDSNMVMLSHQAIDFHFSLREWLNSLHQNLSLAKSSVNPEIIFAAKDMPVFHYFQFPALASFKLFVWSKSIIKDEQYERVLYTPDVLPREIVEAASRVWSLYSSIPSIEIWSDEILNGTLKQLEYYYECGYFARPALVNELYQDLYTLIKQKKEEAAAGKKSEGGMYTLYMNEILIPDNTILATIHGQQMVYINYNTMDLLTTTQPYFCEMTKEYMLNLIRNSAPISATAEKERSRFFAKLEEQIALSKKKILNR